MSSTPGLGRGVGVAAATSTARGRSPVGLALAETVRANVAAARAASEAVPDLRLDHDDFPEAQVVPELGGPGDDGPADDEPRTAEPEETGRSRPASAQIELWDGPAGIMWEVRPTATSLLEDPARSELALQREQLLESYAQAIATDLIDAQALGAPGLTADLMAIWNAIRIRHPQDPYDPVRWNTQAAVADRWGISSTELSRDQALLVGLPKGRLVPLQLFTWKTENDILIEAIAEAPDLFTASNEQVARGITEQEKVLSTAKKFVPWVRAASRHRELVNFARERFGTTPGDFESILAALRAALIDAESAEGVLLVRPRSGAPDERKRDQVRDTPVLHRAIVGGI